jgi:hypothetical protein
VPDESVTVDASFIRRTEVLLNPDVPKQMSDLIDQNKEQLIAIWAQTFGNPAPPSLRKELMVPILAYRIQEKEFGGLSNNSRKKLVAIIETLDEHKRSRRDLNAHLRTGTRLVRSWQGTVHEVSVLPNGFEYRSQHYKSLSEIAREITGTRWSGPAFFGTRKARS